MSWVELERPGPIDKTPYIHGFDKNDWSLAKFRCALINVHQCVDVWKLNQLWTTAVGALSVSLSTLFDEHQIHYRFWEDALPTENNLSLKSFGMQWYNHLCCQLNVKLSVHVKMPLRIQHEFCFFGNICTLIGLYIWCTGSFVSKSCILRWQEGQLKDFISMFKD